MALPESLEEYWFETSDLTVLDAALWMQFGTDPREHNFRCDSDEVYQAHYLEHPSGEEKVYEKCKVLLSAVRANYIKVTNNNQILNLCDAKYIYINKDDWIKWCATNGYIELSNLFKNNNKLEVYDCINLKIQSNTSSTIVSQPNLALTSYIKRFGRNSLDTAIELAIKHAGNASLADVYMQLKDLALNEEKPFNGQIEGDALIYTNDQNKEARLTKNALGKRLKRLKNRLKIKAH